MMVLILACKKQECTEKYTISGRLFHYYDGSNSYAEPMKNHLIRFDADVFKPGAFAILKKSTEHIGEVYTDEYGSFSFSYGCLYSSVERVFMLLSESNQNGVNRLMYHLPPNKNVFRDFSQISHARIVFELDNQSEIDTLYLSRVNSVFDSGNVNSVLSNNFLAVSIKDKNEVYFGYTTHLINELWMSHLRTSQISYGISCDALKDRDFLGQVRVKSLGAPYYDTVRIELK
jgi:hypothetical protein